MLPSGWCDPVKYSLPGHDHNTRVLTVGRDVRRIWSVSLRVRSEGRLRATSVPGTAYSNKMADIPVITNFCLIEVLVRRRLTWRESWLIVLNLMFEEALKTRGILRYWILLCGIPEIPSAMQFFFSVASCFKRTDETIANHVLHFACKLSWLFSGRWPYRPWLIFVVQEWHASREFSRSTDVLCVVNVPYIL